MPEVSLLATFIATLLAFGLGALWYGPLFAKAWMAESGFTQEALNRDFDPAKTFGTTFALAAISAYTLGALLGSAPGIARGLGMGLAAGICFVAAAVATNYLFERRSPKLWLINGGYHAVRFALMGLAFAVLG
jgi:hypothetical protein